MRLLSYFKKMSAVFLRLGLDHPIDHPRATHLPRRVLARVGEKVAAPGALTRIFLIMLTSASLARFGLQDMTETGQGSGDTGIGTDVGMPRTSSGTPFKMYHS